MKKNVKNLKLYAVVQHKILMPKQRIPEKQAADNGFVSSENKTIHEVVRYNNTKKGQLLQDIRRKGNLHLRCPAS